MKRPTGILGLIFKQLLLGLRVLWDPGSQGGIAYKKQVADPKIC